MKVIKNTLQASNGEIELYIIGDTHIGSSQFNEPLLVDLIHHILEKKNRYCILNGDVLDCSFVDSKGNVYENEMQPQVALSYACNLLKPLAKAGRILCSTGGNHDDDRSMRLIGVSLAQQLCVLLGIPEIFSNDSVMLLLTIVDGVKGHKNAKVGYKVFVSHGNNGGGGMVGSKANALEKMSLVCPVADVYIHGHTHAPFTFKDQYVDVNEAKGVCVWRERMYVNGNAFMKYFNGYGEKRLMKPQSQSIPVIRLKAVRLQEGGRKRTIDRVVKHMSCEI